MSSAIDRRRAAQEQRKSVILDLLAEFSATHQVWYLLFCFLKGGGYDVGPIEDSET